MGAKLGSGGGPMAEINVTPLIDVVLVLLVVFMVITPMLKSGKDVDLPKSTQAVDIKDLSGFVIVAIDDEGKLWVDQAEVDEDLLIDAVRGELNVISAANATKEAKDRKSVKVLVKADRNLPYRDVRALLDLLAKNNMPPVLATSTEG